MRRLAEGWTLESIAGRLSGDLARGDASAVVRGLATLQSAGPDDLSFLSGPNYKAQARETRAGVVLVSQALAGEVAPASALIVVPDAYRAYAAIAREFEAATRPPESGGVHPSAVVDPAARIGEGASIGARCVIEAGARIGAGAAIGAGSYVGAGAGIGAGTVLHPNVTVLHGCEIGERCIVHSGTVIGSDGFGFARGPEGWEKIPQLGRVVIGDDVEIGSNCSIDRGALDDTLIGNGCKIDNLVQVAHNVVIGELTAIAGCVGIAGSARIGRRCMIGGAVGIAGHLEICDDVFVGGMSKVSRSIRKPGAYNGVFPLMDNAEWEKSAAVLRQLPQMRQRLRRIESQDKEPE